MRANIREVAKRCGVSIATVSRALNAGAKVAPETRREVLRVAQKLGYRPFPNSRLLSQGKAPSLALVLPGEFCLLEHSPFHMLGLQAVVQEMSRLGGAFTVPHEGVLTELRQTPFHLSSLRGVDAVLILYRDVSADEHEGLARAKIPYLVVGRRPARPEGNYILMDLGVGAELAVRHLVERGHRRIGYWGMPVKASMAGFRRALKERGIEAEEEWIVAREAVSEPERPADWDDLFPWGQLGSPNRPTAFLCHNDMVAVEMMKRLRARGAEVPRDVSVIGFDDLPIAASADPPLTTVRQPVYEMARSGVQAVLEIARGERTGYQKVVKAEVIERKSVARPAKR